MIKVKKAEYVKDYKIEITFNNDEAVVVNLENELEGEVFSPLKDIDVFNKFYVDAETGTLTWPNGADFAPEFLLEIGIKVALN